MEKFLKTLFVIIYLPLYVIVQLCKEFTGGKRSRGRRRRRRW